MPELPERPDPSAGTRPDPADLLDLAVDLALRAGRLLVEGRPADPSDLDVGTKSSATDVVTAMDRAAEQLIAEGLAAARPGDAVLGEEGTGADTAPPARGVRWVVDPVDGTTNYVYGLPEWAVSIAAEIDGVPAVGVVHHAAAGRTFTARRGQGAYVDGQRLTVRGTSDVAQALVATGFGYTAQRRRWQAEVLLQVLPRIRDVRRCGAASLDLCSVAEGRVDAYFERGLQPWDLAAGGLIAAEAGATVGGLHGAPAGERMVLAAPPALFPALHDLLVAAGADRDG